MCQIIIREYNKKNGQALLRKDLENIKDFEKLLSIKGGGLGQKEGYSISILNSSSLSDIHISKNSFIELYDALSSILNKFMKELNKLKYKPKLVLCLFSRQRPEMEKKVINISPYFNNYMDCIYFVHGTISNDKQLSKSLNRRISVDTEIFAHLRKQDFEKLKGLYSYIEIDHKLNIKMIDRGMGKYIEEKEDITTYSTTNIFSREGLGISMVPRKKELKNKHIILKIAFSGGMDSVLNTYKIFSDLEKKLSELTNFNIEVELIYFEYGCNAENEELNASHAFMSYLKHKDIFKSLNINQYEENLERVVVGISSIAGEASKLLDTNAFGDIVETESTSAYVPFRNSLMVQTLIAQAQKEFDNIEVSSNDHLIMVGLGLNLSDGQVYGDNNIAWLENIEKMCKYGGKRYGNIKLLSPYINRTKTNMIREFKSEFGKEILNELLDISFSCYYPKDGKACGSCGSCILREKAING